MTTNIAPVPSTIPTPVAHQAVEWLMDWQSSDNMSETWEQLCEWRRQHPIHEQAWQVIEATNQKFAQLSTPKNAIIAHTTLTSPVSSSISSSIPSSISRSTTPANHHGFSRRDAIKALGVFAFIGSGGWFATENKLGQRILADYSTAVGEQQRITLPDGTVVTLNSNTAINVLFSSQQRRVELVSGEIYIRTATAQQPFIVQVNEGELRPLGTEFSVRQYPNRCRVAVYQGRVQASPTIASQSTIIDAEQSLSFTPGSWSRTEPVSKTDAAWTQGIIVADNMPLGDFLAELSRHRKGIIQCAPEIAQLKISGAYPLHQVDKVLAALPHALPIQLQLNTRYWVRVAAIST